MAKTKTNKTMTKRFKVTSTGKVVRRSSGTNHSRTRRPTKVNRDKRKPLGVDYPVKKIINY